MNDINSAREKICEIDKQMAELFCERMKAAETVAAYKKENGLPILDAKREEFLIVKNSKYITDEAIRPFYVDFLKSNMDISKKYQTRINEGMRVAFSGVKGAFAELAAKKIFPNTVTVGYSNFKEAYESVENGECDCVMLPLENSYNGDVGQVMDLAFFGSLYINGIYDFSIKQCLLAKKGTRISDIKDVISHPQAFGQCSAFINEHKLNFIECENTAVAAKTVANTNRTDLAAIASQDAAEEYGLEILQNGINDDTTNTTRFAVFSKTLKAEHKNDNEFIMFFTVKNESGSLKNALSVIGDNGFNLRALKSRPAKDLIWSYYFYVEGEGNVFASDGKNMLNELNKTCNFVKVVGSFEKI